jgi:hypothetical protein
VIADTTIQKELAVAQQATGWTADYGSTSIVSESVDNMECEFAQNMTLNPLYTIDVKQTLEDFDRKMSCTRFSPTSDTDPRGVVSAELIRAISQNLTAFTNPNNSVNFIVYSAHDTTVIGLLVSLGILHQGDSDWLPFFATSVTFELRQDGSNWYVNALIGRPEKTGPNFEDVSGWNYVREKLQLKCPSPSDQCSLADFASFVAKQAGPPSETGGCCYRSQGFYSWGCDNYAASNEKLPLACQQYRRLCPKTACGPDQVLESNTLRCINSFGPMDGDSWKTVGAIFIALSIILLIAALGIVWRKQVHPFPTDRSYQQVNA